MAKKKINVYKEDEDITVKLDKKQLGIAFSYILKYGKKLTATLLIIMFGILVANITPFLFKYVYDVVIPEKNINMLYVCGCGFLVLVSVSIFVNKYRMKQMNIVGQSIIYDIRKDLFAHIQKLPFSFFDTRPQGKILIRVTNYVNALADMFSNGVANAIVEIFTLIVVTCFMFATNVKLTLISLLGLPVLMVVLFSIKTYLRKARRDYNNKSSNLNAYLHESISGVKITQAFVRKRKNSRIFSHLSVETFRAWMKVILADFSLQISTVLISDITVCITYFLAIVVLSGEDITVGVTIAMITYVTKLWEPINNLANLYNQIVTNAAYLERILETMDEDIMIEDKEDAYPLPQIKGNIDFINLDFKYDENSRYIFKDFNLNVKAGEKIALVGHTGAGKTTIVNLLSRYYEINAGDIKIDGHSIKDITLASLRSQVGYMLQESYIFSGTIMDNIRYGRLDASNDDVIAAAKAVTAHDFITELKDGYDTYVTERGTSLSQGQRQFISLARTMLMNPKVLILDEATASIDTQTEKRVIEGINKLTMGRTCFMVAHRLSTIVNADRILVIGNQSIIEQGSHADLMDKKGVYHDFYTTQTQL